MLTQYRIVEDNVSTALVIEDDADWDVNIKSQLQSLSTATRDLGKTHDPWTGDLTKSPYRDDWDMLWLGTCGVPPAGDDTKTFPGEGKEWPHQIFMVFHARGGLACTYGYAVNKRSARSLLGWLLDVDDPIDFEISRWCERNNCIAVWPQLIGAYESAGQFKDSNIRHGGEDAEGRNPENSAPENEIREKGSTRNIVNSAILNTLERLGHEGSKSP